MGLGLVDTFLWMHRILVRQYLVLHYRKIPRLTPLVFRSTDHQMSLCLATDDIFDDSDMPIRSLTTCSQHCMLAACKIRKRLEVMFRNLQIRC